MPYVMPCAALPPVNETDQGSLKAYVADRFAPLAKPDFVAMDPPAKETRSGKIMRRILRKIACDETGYQSADTLQRWPIPSRVERAVAEPVESRRDNLS